MLVGFFDSWILIPIVGVAIFIATIVYLFVSNHKMKRESNNKDAVYMHKKH